MDALTQWLEARDQRIGLVDVEQEQVTGGTRRSRSAFALGDDGRVRRWDGGHTTEWPPDGSQQLGDWEWEMDSLGHLLRVRLTPVE